MCIIFLFPIIVILFLTFNFEKNKPMKNKIIVLALSLFMFGVYSLQAQVSVGAKGGLNVSNLNGISDLDGFKSTALVGFHLGGYATFNLGRNFAIQPELLFSTQGSTVDVIGEEENLKMNFINIPVMIKFLTNKGVYLEAGPQIGFRAGDVTWGDENLNEDFKNSEFSACFGLGFQPTKSAFGVGARYNLGLGKVADLEDFDENTVDVKSGVFQLSVYWRFLGGGKLKDNHKTTKLPKNIL
jgi:hypothetical protein